MPELPEVETTAADLRPDLLGQQISGVHVLWARTIATPTPEAFIDGLMGQQVERIGRRGKYVMIEMASGYVLLVHLRMSGRLRVESREFDPEASPHVRAWMELGDGRRLVFTDMRKFGRMWLVRDAQEVLEQLGPEPLDPFFSAETFRERIAHRRAPVKNLLLDQTVVAGIGNIYADEALFLAGIHPLRRGTSLSADETERLYEAIRHVLAAAINGRGTTLRDYVPPYGSQGNFQDSLQVYGRNKGEPCPTCGTPLIRIVIAQRSAHYCPHCQPEPKE